jgi:RNA polymerase sigma factor (sigma-70 family)
MSDFKLLRQYCGEASEAAFAELVRRHIDWVYSVCRRQVRDAELAEDVTQAVFITLARKGSGLSESVSISGWLFKTARYASATAVKIENRRRIHERQAASMISETINADVEPNWQRIEPILDQALARLSASDREAVILRYLRGMSHEAIATSLKISEEAAKKRVSRAIDRLRKSMGRAGSAVAPAVMATLISERATQAAPVHLFNKSVLALKGSGAGRPELIVKGMSFMRKVAVFKIVVAAVAVIATSATTLAIVKERFSPSAVMSPASFGVVSDPALEANGQFDVSNVQTFCVAGTEDGLTLTSYYRRKVGVVQHFSEAGWSATHYVLGHCEWVMRDGGAIMLQKIPMQDSDAMIAKLEANLASFDRAKVREPGLDETVEGAPCQAYRLEGESDPFKNATLFIDPATGRPARIKTDNSAIDLTFTYDPEVPDSMFTVPTNPGVTTLTAGEFLERKYPLQGALITKQGVGQIFAVHEATRDAAGCFHIICSSRLTDAVHTALENVPDDQELGKFMMSDRAKFPFHYMLLAEARESGFQVSYLLAIPETLPAVGNACRLPVEMGASNVVLDAAKISYGAHSGHDVHIPVSLDVALKPDAPSAIDFAGRAYDEISPLVGLFSDTEMTGPGFMNGLASREDTLIEVQEKLTHFLPDATQQ